MYQYDGKKHSQHGQLTVNLSTLKKPAVARKKNNQIGTRNVSFQMPIAEWREGAKRHPSANFCNPQLFPNWHRKFFKIIFINSEFINSEI